MKAPGLFFYKKIVTYLSLSYVNVWVLVRLSVPMGMKNPVEEKWLSELEGQPMGSFHVDAAN